MTVVVRLDEHARTLGAILALTDWPDREQSEKPYQPHRVAIRAREFLSLNRAHPSVAAMQRLLDDGQTPRRLYQAALLPDLAVEAHLIHFRAESRAAAFLEDTAADWAEAEADAREVFGRADLASFLSRLFGSAARTPVFIPNLLYPGAQPFALGPFGNEVVALAPPPKAWGMSPPWRYSERPDEVLATACQLYCRRLFEDLLISHAEALARLKAIHRADELFALAATGLFLREAEGLGASESFLMIERKTRALDALNVSVAVLRKSVESHAGAPLEYLPQWAAELRQKY